jgi:Zn-dependent protease/predicted transcriptional regulator
MPPPSSPGSIQVARVLGIPVYVHFSWFVIFGLIAWTLATGYFPQHYPNLPVTSYWAKGLVASLLFFVSILLHELGHSLVARASGIGIRSITLFIFGGVARLEKDPPDGRTELRMAAAGPAVSLALSALFLGAGMLARPGGTVWAVARYLAMINVVVAVFNLVPAFPLDGGRLLRGLLWKSMGKTRATRLAARSGTLFAYFLIMSGVISMLRGAGISGMWYVLIGWFLKDAAAGAYQSARVDEALLGVTAADAMFRDVATLPGDVSLAEAARDYFLHTGYGAYPVVRGDSVVGLLCRRDILKVPAEEREQTSVQSAMTPLGDRVVVPPGAPLLRAMAKMAESGLGRVLVMEGGRLVGLLTMGSVLRHVRVREELGE